jgi:anti-sigma B factor antagonist
MQARDAFFASPADAGSVGVIDVGERLDARAAEQMKSRFKKLALQGHRRHIIDLSRVDDVDSGGLAGLISTLRAVRDTGGSIDLVANTGHVKQILELCALTRLFKVHQSVQAALAAV